ncbi:GNAT family N-acetyltransferase [Pararhodobacter zhoushanensis]|uniref:GNAT family N-acetyltransferase n=1 Tax=Pararhodobacter zhoushanensis TaxID=2479545 RepID=UPI000F8E44FC|nr:GNAT family N-acetyltransferase [Pararhodobacter zhoushanensis]
MSAGYTLRQAISADAAGMARVLQALVASGQRSRPATVGHVLSHYIDDPERLSCLLAVDAGGTVLGFQSLKRASAGNPYDVTPGWGIIGTHIAPDAARRGIGRGLFEGTRATILREGLPGVDASIGTENAQGLAYYEAMGFRDYATATAVQRKAWHPEHGNTMKI